MASQARIWTILIMCLVIQGAVTCVPSSHSNATSQTIKDAERQCKQWLSREDINTMFGKASGNSSCPCVEQLIQYDINFQKNGRCYEELFFQDGVKRLCCYSDTGVVNGRDKYGGYVLVEQYQTSIESFHDLCCLTPETCDMFYDTFPLEDCKHYRSPNVVTSWGDAHIQTVSGDEYDFNGLGEYIFLDIKNLSLTIQCRLEYITDSNKDATIFTAFAIKFGNRTWEVSLNRSSGDLVYNNRSAILQARQFRHGVLYVLLSRIRFPLLVFSGGQNMTLTVISRIPASTETKGLAGYSIQGLKFRNNTTITNCSSESKIYDFGQSWRLISSSESIFLYNNGGNFTFYNRNVTKPRFPDDYLDDITLMFTLFGNHSEYKIKEFQNVCNVSDDGVKNRCLISIARTNRTDDANMIILNYNRELNKTILLNYVRDQKPQFISDFPNDIRLTLNVNTTFVLEVSNYVHDNDTNDTLTYEVVTTGNITMEIDTYNGTLILDVDETLRDYRDIILVSVIDKWGKANHQSLHIQFCGCEYSSQCLPFTGVTSRTPSTSVQQTECKCGAYFNGSFCEIKLDVCNITDCHPGVLCDRTTDIIDNKRNPCGPCPIGYSGDGLACEDVDECGNERFECLNNGACSNSIGNWTCDCPVGYTTHYGNYTSISCDDVDECAENRFDCSNNGTCKNTIGNWTCDCPQGFATRYWNSHYITCDDVDECAENRFDCSNNGTCRNAIGNWTCDCPQGFATRYWNSHYITCDALFSSQEPSNKITTIGVVIGVVIGSVGCLVLILVVKAAVCTMRRRKSLCQKSVRREESIEQTQTENTDQTLSQYEDLRFVTGTDRLYSRVGEDNNNIREEIADRPQNVNVHNSGRRYENVQESAFNGTSQQSGRQYDKFVF